MTAAAKIREFNLCEAPANVVKSARRYVIALATIISLALAAVAAVNVVVDPYQIWRLGVIPGLEHVKTPQEDLNVVTKIYGIRWAKPRAIILGSSRARMAFDPQRPDWREGITPAYNAGVPGGSIRDIHALFHLAVREAPVKIALIELGFHGFDVNAFNLEMNLKKDDPRLRLRGMVGLLPQVLFGNATRASWETLERYFHLIDYPVFYQRQDGKVEFHAEIFDAPAATAGHEAYFLDIWFRPDPNRSFCLHNPITGENSLAEFSALLDEAHSRAVKLILVIPPMHARRLELISAAGLHPQYERWKRQLVRIVAAHQSEPGSPGMVLWDFTGYDAVTTEPFRLVRKGDTPNRFFWESVHFKDRVGNMILDRIVGDPQPSRPLPPHFGLILTLQNIEAQLASERAGANTYRASHPAQAAEIASLVDQARARAGGAKRCE